MEIANSVRDCSYVAAEEVTVIYLHRRLEKLTSIYPVVNVMLGKVDVYKRCFEMLHFLIYI
jgi:hypothetical protein